MLYRLWYNFSTMEEQIKLKVKFFRSASGNEPVRDWLKSLSREDMKAIGEDIQTVQWGWPLGMPLVRKLEKDLWEIRVHLKDRIARILFTIVSHKEENAENPENFIVLLHGFIKKTQKIPKEELDLAQKRRRELL